MAKKVVSRCEVEVNGKPVDYFKSFTEDEREIRKMIKLMKGHAVLDTNTPHTFKLAYVKPKGTPIDWDSFEGGTFTVALEEAERITFLQASTLKVGSYTVDDENEVVQDIAFGAEERTVE